MAEIKGGEKLDRYLREASAKVTNAATLKVGFMKGGQYPNGTSIPTVAAIQNFGAPSRSIPPRPFFSNMVKDHGDEWPAQIGALLTRHGMDAGLALRDLSAEMVTELQDSITNTNEPPLSPITLMLRKMFGNSPEDITGKSVGEAARRVAAGEDAGDVSTKPLVWTGLLWKSVQADVE